MAITEDMEFPRLLPSDDRLPSDHRLFRRPEELTDEQFDLLAAAWSEDALDVDTLTEVESVMAADNGRRERAESFRRLRLVAGSECWPGMRSCLRHEPVRVSFRRTFVPALMAAAALLALIIAGPASDRLNSKESPGVVTATADMAAAEIQITRPITVMEVIGEAESSPLPADSRQPAKEHHSLLADSRQAVASPGSSRATVADEGAISMATMSLSANGTDIPDDLFTSSGTTRTVPLAIAYQEAALSSLSPTISHQMSPVRMTEITPVPALAQEKNWMLRGITLIAGAVTGKEKDIDGYAIASSCVSGINNLLGWEMELEKISNRAGDPVAVSFSSSLLSFTKPLNKITP